MIDIFARTIESADRCVASVEKLELSLMRTSKSYQQKLQEELVKKSKKKKADVKRNNARGAASK